MRRWIVTGSLALLSLTAAAPARAELWCVRDFGSSQRMCVFGSAQECFFAVRIGGGGICEREGAAPDRWESKRAPLPSSGMRRPPVDR